MRAIIALGAFVAIDLLVGSSVEASTYNISVISIAGGVTEAWHINDAGKVVGDFFKSGMGGFEYYQGGYTTFNPPGGIAIGQQVGINGKGVIVGTSGAGIPGFPFEGFVDTGGTYAAIIVPGAVDTFANDINQSGTIVGIYMDSTGSMRTFLDIGGKFTTIDFPGASATVASSINDAGDIVGYYANGATGKVVSQTRNRKAGKVAECERTDYRCSEGGISRTK